jgi:hypothetical protein
MWARSWDRLGTHRELVDSKEAYNGDTSFSRRSGCSWRVCRKYELCAADAARNGKACRKARSRELPSFVWFTSRFNWRAGQQGTKDQRNGNAAKTLSQQRSRRRKLGNLYWTAVTFRSGDQRSSKRGFLWRPRSQFGSEYFTEVPMLRYGILILAAIVSTACADHRVLENPHTVMTVVCSGSQSVFNPWSQTMACVASREAQGWIRSGQK